MRPKGTSGTNAPRVTWTSSGKFSQTIDTFCHRSDSVNEILWHSSIPHNSEVSITPHATRHLDTRHLGRSILLFDDVSSTNDLAVSFAHDPDTAGTVFVAEHQSNGRGQYGRHWQARPGSSLLLSILLFPPPELRRPVILTAWVAVALGDAIRELAGVPSRIKWPNDLLIGGWKVCGILIEQSGGVVVGLGLNLNQTAEEFAEAGLPEATSLGMIAGSRIDPAEALDIVVRHLDDGYDRLLAGERSALEAEWKDRLGLTGQPVRIELSDGSHRLGHLRDMGFDGIEVQSGEFANEVIPPERIRGIVGC